MKIIFCISTGTTIRNISYEVSRPYEKSVLRIGLDGINIPWQNEDLQLDILALSIDLNQLIVSEELHKNSSSELQTRKRLEKMCLLKNTNLQSSSLPGSLETHACDLDFCSYMACA